MQAIVSDIIVNQAVQSGNLQVSQLLQNNSSSQTSFAEFLNSLRNQETEASQKESALAKSVEDKKPQETSEAAENQKSNKTEKSEEKKDTSEVKDKAEKKDVEKTDVKKTDEKNGKITSKNEESLSKPKLLNNERLEVVEKDSAKKSDVKTNQNTADPKNLKKNLDDKNLNNAANEEIAENELTQNNAALQNASSFNVAKSNDNTKVPVVENDALEIDTKNVSVEQNQNDILQDKLLSDEKVYALDKDSKIIVHDQRTEQTDEAKPAEKNTSKSQLQVQYDNQNNATITMELDQQNASENILSLDNQTAAAEGSNFQAMLNNQIQANAPEFVKAGSLILQDNNKGTINLVLHPDDLGNVKIHLSMDGKTVSAHITVNTKEALEVFKDNAQTLREAFAKNGYETSGFDVSYNGNSQANSQNQTFEGRYDGTEYWARKAYGDSLSGGENDGYIQDSYEFAQNSEYSINIVA